MTTVQLYHGDCLEFMRSLPDGAIDMIWTDPPYGHNNGNGDLAASRVGVKGARQSPLMLISNDAPDQWEELITGFLQSAERVLKPDCCCCCCCGGGPNPAFAKMALWMDQSLEFFHAVVWDKSARGNGLGWRYRRNYEFVMVAKRRNGRLAWVDNDLAVPNILRTPPEPNEFHPTTKPVALIEQFIKWHVPPGATVFDPFMGSGTTGVACVRTGRNFIGCEIDAGYFDIAQRRIAEAQLQPPLFPHEPAVKPEQLVLDMKKVQE